MVLFGNSDASTPGAAIVQISGRVADPLDSFDVS
jgi:hypothetical protein